MKYTTLGRFSTLVASLAALSVAALPSFLLEARSPDSVPNHLATAGTFYHTVVDKEGVMSFYPGGSHPKTHGNSPGDFSSTGGLYVFDDASVAKAWGSLNAKDSGGKPWYLITLRYTPDKSGTVKTFSFGKADSSWDQFIIMNRGSPITSSPRHSFDIVQGPITRPFGPTGMCGAIHPQVVDHEMLWQAAFITAKALETLIITEIRHFPKPSEDPASRP